MLERLRPDPLRALIALEWVAVISSYTVDLAMSIGHINGNPADPRSLIIFSLLCAFATIAVFSCPHVPHRRFVIVIVALLFVCILGLNHTAATSPIVLLLILGTRLTFAFGLRGAVTGWMLSNIVTMLSILDVIIHKPTQSNIIQGGFELIVFGLMATLFFGLIGIMWLYARKGQDTAAAAERARIALDLHDSLGHTLTTLNVHLQNAILLQEIDHQKTRFYLDGAATLASGVLDDVRETVTMLHDDASDFSIAQLIQQLRTDFSSVQAIELDWNVRIENEPRGRSAMALYRILQESLTNIIRHANASHVSVRIETTGQHLELHVADNGRGFSSEHQRGHGLLSMRNRVESLSGTIAVRSSEGAGTRIDVVLPLGAST